MLVTYQCLKDLHLVHEGLEVFDPLLLNGLDGKFLAASSFFGEVDDAEASRRDLFTKVVLILDFPLIRILE